MWYPTIELIEEIYVQQLNLPIIYINKQHLETALDILKWGYPFSSEPMLIWEQAAILMRNIVQFHVFHDGCKRIGIHICYIFLRKNGYLLAPPDPEEIFRLPMAVAKGDLTLEQINIWFKENSVKINQS